MRVNGHNTLSSKKMSTLNERKLKQNTHLKQDLCSGFSRKSFFLQIMFDFMTSYENTTKSFLSAHAAMPDELRLLRDLLTNYDTAARPVKNQSDAVEVKMGIALNQIRELVS